MREKLSVLKFRIHPTMIPIIIILLLSGNVAHYAMILGSLLWHECGHLIAANKYKLKIEGCTIMPYGGEIRLAKTQLIRKKYRLVVAAAGPIATSFLLILALFMPGAIQEPLVYIQFFILFINLLPIWPLDGGRIIEILLSGKRPLYEIHEFFLKYSIITCLAVLLCCILLLPKSVFLLFLFLFILFQNIKEWRYRKYTKAFEKYALNILT
ncbi:site-2 protease family protein [Viridibacillus sp. FSL R5-0477]|uniref:Stage IV sporulation protein FB n=2 Tax=Viridibacillus TaxID=496496 RepID=W4EPC8_9BACL|nr:MULTISPECIES: site-2 protease family protein [Viridibacillus]ETT82453.1 stage IV sporulation protein FB [Viridibacillus arenosi FSL R5-213]